MFKHLIMSLSLKSLQLENFKCFKEEQKINFEKLTLITGANSSGKSSIIQAILSALQSKDFPFLYSTNGKYTNMGDFKEISNRHSPNNIIKIGFTFKDNGDSEILKITTKWEENKSNGLPTLNSLSFERPSGSFRLKKNTPQNNYLLDFEYDYLKDVELKQDYKELVDFQINQIVEGTKKVSELKSKSGKSKKISEIEERKEIEELKKLLGSQYENFNKKNIKVSNLENIQKFIGKYKHIMFRRTPDVANAVFQNFNTTVNFISSFRLHPDRTYLEKSVETLKVGTYGQGYLDQIILWENIKSDKIEELISIMSDLKLFYNIKAHRIGGGRYEILLKPKKTGVSASITDVGFGISQFLPIVVADLQLPNDSTLFVSQPEIHLHPNAQANFGDYLVTQIKEKRKNYILETHSEYLLNRIRLAIVKGELKESDLAVYYLENTNESRIHKIKFGKRGQIEGAPKSFFDTYMMDLKDIAFSVKI